MSLNSDPKSTSSTSVSSAEKDNMAISGSYIFAPDGLILAYPETYDKSTSRRNSDNDINPIRRFSFDSLVKKLF
jgi:hypothetical protein